MLKAYRAVSQAIRRSGKDTPRRRQMLVREAVDLAIRCRLMGGGYETSIDGIVLASEFGWLKSSVALEMRATLRLWFRVGGRIPALIWLNRRFAKARF